MIIGNDPILLTPGPLTTSLATKQAMLRDWGSWDSSFNAITASICKDLVDIVHGHKTVVLIHQALRALRHVRARCHCR